MCETWVQSLGREDPLEKEMAIHSSIIAWKFPWTEQPSRLQSMTGDQWRNNSIKNEGMEPKQKQHPVVNGTGDGSTVRCYKEQYCIGTWNVRSMNQGKLEVVKHEMTRVNIDILGISKLRWTGMG